MYERFSLYLLQLWALKVSEILARAETVERALTPSHDAYCCSHVVSFRGTDRGNRPLAVGLPD